MALRDDQINAKNLISPLGVIGSTAFFWIAIAALFSNILGLSTSLFIMVVYDRVLPNQARAVIRISSRSDISHYFRYTFERARHE